MDKGETFTPISDDLTQGGKKGNVPYGTLTTISESPLKFGLIYTGSDDGLIYGTRDGGVTWKKLSAKLPQNLWVSRVQASAHNEATVYASLNGYRWDDFTAYIYASKDFGKTWERLGTDLPNEPVNVIKEDPFNPKILYVGTDHGLYVSLNEGKNFMRFDANLPHVAVHDLVVQAREKDLVIATHGRSIFIAPIAHLQQLTPEITAQTLHVFEPEAIKHSSRWGATIFWNYTLLAGDMNSFSMKNDHAAAGFGLRYAFDQSSRNNLRLDIAFQLGTNDYIHNPDEVMKVYFTVNEAF